MDIGSTKGESIELICDLIFFYLVGRSSALLQTIENGSVPQRKEF